jgi:hypothetical protein
MGGMTSRGAGWCVSVLAATLLLSSCSTFSRNQFSKLSPVEQESYFGTQPGFHRVSPYFAVAVGGGMAGTDRLMQFYFYENGTSRRHLLGTIEAIAFGSADYGPKEQHFALSADGTALLFFHEAKYSYGSVNKSDGLYLARADGTEMLVRNTGDRVISAQEIATYLTR